MSERERFEEESKGLETEGPWAQTEPKAPLTIGVGTPLTPIERAYQDAIVGARAAADLVVTRGKRIAELEEEVQRLRVRLRGQTERGDDLMRLLQEERRRSRNLQDEAIRLRVDLAGK